MWTRLTRYWTFSLSNIVCGLLHIRPQLSKTIAYNSRLPPPLLHPPLLPLILPPRWKSPYVETPYVEILRTWWRNMNAEILPGQTHGFRGFLETNTKARVWKLSELCCQKCLAIINVDDDIWFGFQFTNVMGGNVLIVKIGIFKVYVF